MNEKAIIYNRVSTSDQNPELQLQECRDYCKNKGWDIIDEIQEKKSGFKDDVVRPKFDNMIERAKNKDFQHIVVWNMDRFSRQEPEKVLRLVKKLNAIYGVDVSAVHGDLWSDMVESVSQIKQSGFMGEALADFLEKIIKGLEFQRANRESQVKSERVKMAITKKGDKSYSYKGNKWGRKTVPKSVKKKVLDMHNKGYGVRAIAKEVYYYDKNRNQKYLSKTSVSRIINEMKQQEK